MISLTGENQCTYTKIIRREGTKKKGLFEHVCIIAAKEHGTWKLYQRNVTKVDGVVFVDMSRTEPFCKPFPLRKKRIDYSIYFVATKR